MMKSGIKYFVALLLLIFLLFLGSTSYVFLKFNFELKELEKKSQEQEKKLINEAQENKKELDQLKEQANTEREESKKELNQLKEKTDRQIEESKKEQNLIRSEIDSNRNIAQFIFDDLKKSVLLINVSGRSGTGWGTGFYVNNNGLILTNEHVIQESSRIKIVDYEERSYDAKVVAVSKELDLALLKIQKTNTPFVEFSTNPKEGIDLYSLGFPILTKLGIKEGILVRKFSDAFEVSSEIQEGMSGGPTVDINGKVIGVNVSFATLSKGDSSKFIVPSNLAEAFVQKHKNSNDSFLSNPHSGSYVGVSPKNRLSFITISEYYIDFTNILKSVNTFLDKYRNAYESDICNSNTTEYETISNLEITKNEFKTRFDTITKYNSTSGEIRLSGDFSRNDFKFKQIGRDMNSAISLLKQTQDYISEYNLIIDRHKKLKPGSASTTLLEIEALDRQRQSNCKNSLKNANEVLTVYNILVDFQDKLTDELNDLSI